LAQGQFGTAAEAKAMLEKAVAAVKADKAKGLSRFGRAKMGSRIEISTLSPRKRATGSSR
jgi:hypothetical protein